MALWAEGWGCWEGGGGGGGVRVEVACLDELVESVKEEEDGGLRRSFISFSSHEQEQHGGKYAQPKR